MLGVFLASGKIIVFLDSHCECGPHWLEPLVDAIQKDEKTVAVPVIDVINSDTLQYQNVKSVPIGGFSW
jgi:polypeptide N-acetylgalactosaminyltransferase